MRVTKFETFENLDNYINNCSPCMHAVDGKGIITWANETELKFMGYSEGEYVGQFIGDFHVDEADVHRILGMLTRFETVHNVPARLRAKDGSIRFVMINSNVYRHAGGEFGHSRCFTTEIGEAMWKALKQTAAREEGGTS